MRKIYLLIIAAALTTTSASSGADGTIWFGNMDESPLIFRVDSDESIPVWIQTNPDVCAAAVHIPLSTADAFITKRLGGTLYKPFVNDEPPEGFQKGWDMAEIKDASPHQNKEGYTSQGILGFSNLNRKPNLPLNCEKPCLIAEFYVHTAADDSLKGHTYDVLIEGYDIPNKGINLSDTLGIYTFQLETIFSQVYFLFPGDINNDFKIDDSDLKALKTYFEKKIKLPWPELRADCDGNSVIDLDDLHYLENYLNGNGKAPR
ncbi:MAG: dockerin type I repeat-containing protein [candidate division Zixibacteria bacterium]|nr:dockerin type I repeat-containing protein [candidate division Zixibacteria bacterium]